jgi:hypothetical protein
VTVAAVALRLVARGAVPTLGMVVGGAVARIFESMDEQKNFESMLMPCLPHNMQLLVVTQLLRSRVQHAILADNYLTEIDLSDITHSPTESSCRMGF